MEQKILIVDFGSQYTQLIARKIRELNVYSEIIPFYDFKGIDKSIKGVILSGSPYSVREKNFPKIDLSVFEGKIPVLGICYGAQLIVQLSGGVVEASEKREYGRARLLLEKDDCRLFDGVENNSVVWMSHSDSILKLPESFEIVARTENIPVAAFRNREKNIFGLQFHPEVYHTEYGKQILDNFLKIIGISRDWTPKSFVEETVNQLRQKLGNDKVVLGLSGGVDSSVAALLLHKAIGKNLTCIFVDTGLLRYGEFDEVLKSYENLGLNVIGVDAKEEFYTALKGISDPEKKRKTIGKVFIDVFTREAEKIKDVKWLAQGTIYPDVIESAVKGAANTIKSHHNVGGLPEKMKLKLVEPLRMLFKDEVRKVGKELGLPGNILNRHPFPGPGLAIRILGEITPEKVKILQKADHIFIKGLKDAGLYDKVWQAATILLPVKSVGVMGDERTYENVIVLRAVNSTDGMTADWSRLPYDFLAKISNEIINSVKGVNRVVYDISSKPPATIEWE